jgi:hypothetical protein
MAETQQVKQSPVMYFLFKHDFALPAADAPKYLVKSLFLVFKVTLCHTDYDDGNIDLHLFILFLDIRVFH